MYTAYRTEMGRLRAFERDLTGMYADAIAHRRFDEAKAIFDRRRKARRAILRAEEWREDGVILQFPQEARVEEDLARVA
jgi:hypothetical protein